MIFKKDHQGFTIVELILVITVIAILATIGLVSWNGARSTAKQNAAKTTISKMKISLSDYFTDNNRYPVNKAAICNAPTYSVTPAGDLYTEFCVDVNQAYYLYTASPSGCNNTSTLCTSYTLTAQKAIWGGPTDVTLQP